MELLPDFSLFSPEERKRKAAKRQHNREYSTAFLAKKKIEFTSLNGGVHLRITAKGQTIDFWPSTGLWVLKGGTRNRGIFKLYKYIRDEL